MFKTPNINQLPHFLKALEAKWISKRINQNRNRYINDDKNKPLYVLSMFPYPSGRLHLGHARCYTNADIMARFYGLMGKQTINPMGFDSFGLPAENAARERNLDPAVWTNDNIRTMKKQLDDLGIRFDWREATSNPSYYKWTQEIFLKLLDANMIYKSYSRVNWDPIDKTVLADEQVDEEGRSWRSGALVKKINCKQWFVKVSAFTKALYEATDVDADEWGDILLIQKEWVGKPNGYMFYLPINDLGDDGHKSETLLLFVKKPELFLNPDIKLIISREHWLEMEYGINKVKYVQNPFNNSKIEIEFAKNPDELPANCNATLSDNIKIDMEQSIDGTTNEEDKIEVDSVDIEDQITRKQILLQASLNGLGGYHTNEKYRDWLISRQRFWGTPIPMIHLPDGSCQGVSRDELPVKLPKLSLDYNNNSVDNDTKKSPRITNERGVNKSKVIMELPLQKYSNEDWLEVKDKQTGQIIGTRDCETLDTMFDSAWYFLRYAADPVSNEPFDSKMVQPVHIYIGGKEHAYMHLFYARFMTHFLNSLGQLDFKEPFRKLLVQGHVKSKTYKTNGRYVSHEEAAEIIARKGTKLARLETEYEKMSKSKGNGVDPENLLDKYGIDATRLCLISYANPRSERLWRSDAEEFKDVNIFLRRVILTVEEFVQANLQAKQAELQTLQEDEDKLTKTLKATRNRLALESLVYIHEKNEFRQYLSSMHIALGVLRNVFKNFPTHLVANNLEFAKTLANLLIVLNPAVPHLTEELWFHLGNTITRHPRLSLLGLVEPTATTDQQPETTSASSHNNLYFNLHVKDQRWPLADSDYLASIAEHKRQGYEKALNSIISA